MVRKDQGFGGRSGHDPSRRHADARPDRPKGAQRRAKGRADDGRTGNQGDKPPRAERKPATEEGRPPVRRTRAEHRPTEDTGFGPYAGQSRDFEGGRRRQSEAKGSRRRSEVGEPVVRKAARDAVARGAARRPALRITRDEAVAVQDQAPGRKRTRRAPGTVRQLAAAAPPAAGPRPPRLADALQKASRAIERGYGQEALRILRPLKDRHPTDPDVRELLGVALYRLERWAAARKELEAFVELTGSATQHPLLMDAARALGRHTVVERLWEELRAASPAADVMTEGRIVAAGSLADRDRIPEAIRLLERGPVSPKRIAEHHLRLWYALADLHERAGDLPGARFLFRKVSARDPGFVDVAERLAALS